MDHGAGWQELRRRETSRSAAGPFGRLARTHAAAMAGDTLVTLALAGSLFFSISPNEARGRVALSLVLTMAPFALVAPVLGPAVDRSRQGERAMIVLTCAGRAAGCLFMVEVLQGLLLFPAAFSVLVLSKAYAVARSALVPAVVRGEAELVEANAKLSIVAVLAGFAAAVPGVVLLRLADARWVLRLAAAVFLVAVVLGLRLPARSAGSWEAAPEGGDVRGHGPGVGSAAAARPRAAGGDGGAGSAAHPALRLGVAAVAMALFRAVVGFVTFLVAFAFRREDAPSWWFGLVLAAGMAGGLAGAVVAPRLREVMTEERMLQACLAAVAIAGLGFARLEGTLWAAGLALVVGLAAATAKLAFDALVQHRAPGAARGANFARFETGFQLVWVVGALLPVLVGTPLRQGYDVVGIATFAALVAYVVVLRRIGGWRPHTPGGS